MLKIKIETEMNRLNMIDLYDDDLCFEKMSDESIQIYAGAIEDLGEIITDLQTKYCFTKEEVEQLDLIQDKLAVRVQNNDFDKFIRTLDLFMKGESIS
ncbi:hypothetical protein [Carnobacterium divergens]|uniref:Uncharacterized protein n=1 Tax=Carnobacterium divergens TaxID=2748 RepID=A0A7Z8CWC8_CARDV|nr:hypothetical protein [Carnobacterium divergens]TFI70111.1 hypothetical protein CKN58_11820 [Carnobacterium divergens]TFI75105.1 hypothetical protein CKN85_11875 [Carnobacterium divergens]TFI80929.1 hypothetical protein CKN56_11905 [Carnobacterium divergens]TFI93336.1 hypothetical protein CKN64_11840 [Carnobacterium divergens]TFJ09368.1 hypothetical protein CKN60_11870 [Carnobacterium divergens]